MNRMRWLIAASLALALVATGVGVGIASEALRSTGARDTSPLTDEGSANPSGEAVESEGPDGDGPVTGADADAASVAALAYTDATYARGGRVSEVEAGDDGAAFGVEVTLLDGRQVEVHVDAQMKVIGDEIDDD